MLTAAFNTECGIIGEIRPQAERSRGCKRSASLSGGSCPACTYLLASLGLPSAPRRCLTLLHVPFSLCRCTWLEMTAPACCWDPCSRSWEWFSASIPSPSRMCHTYGKEGLHCFFWGFVSLRCLAPKHMLYTDMQRKPIFLP